MQIRPFAPNWSAIALLWTTMVGKERLGGISAETAAVTSGILSTYGARARLLTPVPEAATAIHQLLAGRRGRWRHRRRHRDHAACVLRHAETAAHHHRRWRAFHPNNRRGATTPGSIRIGLKCEFCLSGIRAAAMRS